MVLISPSTVSLMRPRSMVQSLTVISNEFPIRSPSCMALLPV